MSEQVKSLTLDRDQWRRSYENAESQRLELRNSLIAQADETSK